MKNKILVIILIAIIILSTNVMVTFAETKSELNKQNEELQTKINETEDKIESVKDEMSTTMNQIQELSTKITGYEDEISDLNGQISDVEKQITETQKKLEEAEKQYNNQEGLLESRLVALYEAGDTTYLDVLLSSKGVTDFISNYYLVSELAEYDTELLSQMEKNKNEIIEAKNSLETNKKQIEALKTNKQATASSLKNSQSVKEEYVEGLSEDEKSLQEEIEKLRKEQDEVTKKIKDAEKKYQRQIESLPQGNGTLQKPVNSNNITATMYYSTGKYHGALDYGIPVGTNIYAAETGVVLVAGWGSGYGNYICIQHGNGLRTYYAHGNGTFYVSPGDTVSRGQVIMLSGNSGNSTGPHLHFEVRVAPYSWSYGGNDSRRDPRNYL